MNAITGTLTCLALAWGLLALSTPAAAQEGPERLPPVSVGSDHWVYPLLDRMAADGLLDGVWIPGRRPVGADAIAAALDSAVARTDDASPWAVTAAAAGAWVRREYGHPAGRLRVLPTAGGRLSGGPVTDPTSLEAGARLRWQPHERVGLWAHPVAELGAGGPDAPFPRLGGAWSVGPVRLSASYEPKRLGPGASGGLVLDDGAELGWLEVALDRPVVLPWVLKWLGPFQISLTGSRIEADTLGRTVGFVASEFRLQPHPRVTLSLNRTAVFVTELNGETLDAREIFLMITASRSGASANFDDQKASMTGSVRLDLFGVTLTPYFEWAWEDTWEIDEDPGTILGVRVPSIPVGREQIGLRYEYAAFGERAQIIWPWSDIWQHRFWYRRNIGGRILYAERPGLAHPLGGYGSEHRLEAEAPVAEQGLLIRGALFTRERIAGITLNQNWDTPRLQEYSNLLYDDAPGRSWGGSVDVAWTGDRLRLDGRVALELGGAEGWSRAVGAVRATWLLP